jgi:chemotaxis methyl-accepting protein methylase
MINFASCSITCIIPGRVIERSGKGSKNVFAVIFLRNNVLTYCRQEARKKAVISVLNCLTPGGLFIIGCHETLPFKADRLIPMNRFPYVFCSKA